MEIVFRNDSPPDVSRWACPPPGAFGCADTLIQLCSGPANLALLPSLQGGGCRPRTTTQIFDHLD